MDTQENTLKIEQRNFKSFNDLYISYKAESIIRNLLSKLPTTEWSGILFYTLEEKDGIYSIIANDVLLMDIGDTTATEFEMDADVVGYMTDNNLLNNYIGLIH